MSLDIGTLVAKVKVDDSEFESKTSGWSGRGAAVASAFGNIAADAISQATSMLTTFVGEAATASDATKKFKDTLKFAGVDDSTIKQFTKSTQKYADQTVYSLSDIQSITAQLASNGIEGPDNLAKALGNLNAVAGGNADTFGRVGMTLTQTAGAGKLTTENWNQLAEAIPGASGVLQDALLKSGAYTGNFRDAMAEGQITADEFNAALLQVGTDPVAVEAAKSVETFEGAQGNLAAAIQSQLVAALDMIKPAFTGLQNGIAWFISNSGLLIPVIIGLGAALLVALAPAIWAGVVAMWAFTVALLANPMTWIVIGVGLLVAAIVWLIQNWDVAVKWITDVWGGLMTWLGDVIDAFAGWWDGVWSGISQFFIDLWDGIVSFFTDVINNVVAFVQDHWGLLLSFLIGPIGLAIQWIVENWSGIMAWFHSVISGFVSWWNGIWSGVGRFLGDLWNNVASTTKSVWDGIISWFRSIPDTIKNIFTGAMDWLYNIGRDIVNGLWRGLKSVWSSVSGWFQNTFGGIIDTVKGIFQINSPSRVFAGIGSSVGEGMIKGLVPWESKIDGQIKSMMKVPQKSAYAGGFGSSMVSSRENNIYLTVPEGTTTEEALFAALGSPRVKD